MEYPKLRWPLEVRLEKSQGEEFLLIRCPVGISEQPLALIPAVAPLVACFDGNRSINEISNQFSNAGATIELVTQLAELLEQHLFLDSPHYEHQSKVIRSSFREATAREAALAGFGYPSDTEALAYEIDSYLKNGSSSTERKAKQMIGLVSPHIDYRRGGLCYGITYNTLREEQHDLYILIGTAHQFSRLLFHLTNKDFLSPFDAMHCDKEFMDLLAQRYGIERSYQDEFLHKQEHSLELQIPFLKRLQRKALIAPILVGSFHQMITSERSPNEFPEYSEFVESICECLSDRLSQGQKVCFVAGVDMAHVGAHFGDKGNLTEGIMRDIEERDRIYLETIINQDKQKMFEHIAEDGDARRICGFPTMYTVIDICDRLQLKYDADLFDYRQAVDYESDCAVTFAGVGMYL